MPVEMAGKATDTRPWCWQSSIARIAGGQRLVFTAATVVPDGTDRVNHVTRRQTVCGGDFGSAGLAAPERPALLEKVGSGGAMDSPIDATTPEQRRVRGVDDGVNAQGRDVGENDFQPRRAKGPAFEIRFSRPARSQAQARVETVTPLSAKSCCNSPA